MIADKNLELATAWAPRPPVGSTFTLATTVDLNGVALSRMTDPTDGDATINENENLARDISQGEPLFIVFTVNAVGGASTNCELRVAVSDNDDGSSGTTICRTPDFNPQSGIAVGDQIALQVSNPLKLAKQRYLTVQIKNNAGGTMTDIDLQVHLVHGDPTGPQVYYPTAFISPDGF